MPTTIFLSYARDDDEPFVKRLHADLTKAGFEVWFDRASMPSRSLTLHQEIRDAIASRERLILVVGPKAITSDYVKQEWQFAYYASNKCVNPIVRLDDCDSQGNKVDAYALIPEDLKLLHAEDFRRDAEYDEHLKNLIRQLSESLPPVGKLVAVPELPPGYRAQPERLKALRDLLLLDLQKPVVVTGAAARVGLQGMGGIGKSVLANALAHHPEVQRAFQDGIYWVTLGQQPRLEELQRQLAVTLGGDGQFNSRHEGKEQLRQLLTDRAALLILDDVWERDHADAFNVAGARSRILLTTRDAALVTALAARENHYRVELPTLAEAQAIFGGAADVPPDQLPSEADAIIKECDRLPLALALCGGMVHGGSSWSKVLAALQEHDLEFLCTEHPNEPQHQNAWKAMDISLRVLPAEEQRRFAELAVFSADTGAPDAAVATLWQHTAGLNPRQAEALLGKFIRRSLVQRPTVTDGLVAARVDLHDLLHHFATGMAIRQFGSLNVLHQRLLDAYQTRCLDGWPSGPHDGYFFANLVRHIVETGAWSKAEAVVTNFSWLMRKCEHGLLDSITNDYGVLLKLLATEMKQRLEIWAKFFREKAHILRRGNDEWQAHKILLQLAMEHADDSPLTLGAESWLAAGNCDWLWLRRVPRSPNALQNPCLVVLEGHAGSITGALDMVDGRLLSWSDDHTLRLWDGQVGACLTVLKGHTGSVSGALILADGRLLSWSDDHTLRIWDDQSGACLKVLAKHAIPVSGALALADGRLLSWAGNISSGPETFRLWDSRSGACLKVLKGHDDQVSGALALADGRLLSWAWDHTLRLWGGRRLSLLAVLEGHTGPVCGALALADGRLLSWAGALIPDQTLRLWDGQSGACLAVLEGHTDGVAGALVLAEGRLLSWAFDNTLRLWDSQSAICLKVMEGHTDFVSGAVSLADGRLLSWSEDRTLRLWDGHSGESLAVFKGHTNSVEGALVMADGRLLSWSKDETLRLWDRWSGVELKTLGGHTCNVLDTLVLAEERFLSWAGDNRSGEEALRLWDARSGICLRVLEGHTAPVYGALALADGRLLSWARDASLRLWDSRSGNCLKVLEGHTNVVSGALALADGRLISWSSDRTLRLWDSQTGECLAVLEGHTGDVVGALALATGRLVSWSDDQTVRLWDGQTGTCLAALEGHTGAVGGALALADGRLLSWAGDYLGRDHTLRLWDGENGACLATLSGHTDYVVNVLPLTRGRLLSWSLDRTLRIWDGQSGACLEVFEGHTEWVDGAVILTEERLLSWAEDSSLRLWNSQNGECLEV